MKPRAISSEAPLRGTFNDHPKGVPPSGGKRGARKRDDMVCSAWKHAAVRMRTGAEPASRVEQTVKRAGFRWGIGRELYTAPFIWVESKKLKRHRKNEKNGRWQCYDDFRVTDLVVDDGQIVRLQICNASDRMKVVYGQQNAAEPPETPKEGQGVSDAAKRRLWAAVSRYAELHGDDPKKVAADLKATEGWREEEAYYIAKAEMFEGECDAI